MIEPGAVGGVAKEFLDPGAEAELPLRARDLLVQVQSSSVEMKE
jgi:hypothetical protein